MVNIKKFFFCDIEIFEEVVKREKESGIWFDLDVDIYMKVMVMLGNKVMFVVEYIIRVSMYCDNFFYYFMKFVVFFFYILVIGNVG